MVNKAIFINSDEFTKSDFNHAKIIKSLYDFVGIVKNGEECDVVYNLYQPAQITSPVFDYKLLSTTICTNNLAAIIYSSSKEAAFFHTGRYKELSISESSLELVEQSIFKQSVDFFGDKNIMKLGEKTEEIRRLRINRLDVLRCIIHQMSKEPNLDKHAHMLETEFNSVKRPMLKDLT